MLFNVTKARRELSRPPGAACIHYAPLFVESYSGEFLVHQNRWCALEIARLLGELGYVVDVIDWNINPAMVEDSYDLLIGFGQAAEVLPWNFATGLSRSSLRQAVKQTLRISK